jgi:tRNA (guanine26-N2/guanine27-N2)-dimethyltransferase
VFYNPDMALDRDLGVAFATAHFPTGEQRGWEMLGATGARGLRLLVESGRFASLLFTEAHPEAADVLRQNAAAVPGATVRVADARVRPPEAPFDYVDLDPYGSPIPFVPAALDAVRPGGVLAVTATDLMVLAGVQPGACERRYGSHPVRGRLGPEGGLRVLLAYLARVTRAQGRTVRPLLAYVRGHHLRAFLEVDSPSRAGVPDPVGMIDTATWTGPYLGDRGPYGPFWLGPLFDPALVAHLSAPPTAARPKEAAEFLARIQAEVGVDRPFYYESNELAAALGLPFPPSREAFTAALTAQGFRTARTHVRPEGFRTDAPRSIVEATARELGGRPADRSVPASGARPAPVE